LIEACAGKSVEYEVRLLARGRRRCRAEVGDHESSGRQKTVIFPGFVKEVAQSVPRRPDAFVFPSEFEGLGTAIASGDAPQDLPLHFDRSAGRSVKRWMANEPAPGRGAEWQGIRRRDAAARSTMKGPNTLSKGRPH